MSQTYERYSLSDELSKLFLRRMSETSSLGKKKNRQSPNRVVLTLSFCWLFSTVVYALHYAHLFYTQSSEGKDSAGLHFPGTKEPDRGHDHSNHRCCNEQQNAAIRIVSFQLSFASVEDQAERAERTKRERQRQQRRMLSFRRAQLRPRDKRVRNLRL